MNNFIMLENNLKISIVTPSYNQGHYIEETILSVLNQNYTNFEHIIIDGGSNDNTIEILKKYNHLKWVSEKDGGQSNAINKGFSIASGDIFAWLNSDDYYEKNIFLSIMDFFSKNPECDFLYGDITYVDEKCRTLFSIEGEEINFYNLLNNPDLIRQPSFFWRREKFFEFGGVDESLNLVMDFDLFLKFTKLKTPGYIGKNLSYYRMYEKTKTVVNRREQAIEIYKVIKKHSQRLSYKMSWFLFKRYFGSFSFFSGIKKIQKSILNFEK